MQPEKRAETIVREYWGCTIAEHRHATEKAASACIKRQSVKGTARRWESLELNWVIAMRDSGHTFAEIGAKFGVSANRAMQVYRKALRSLRRNTVYSEANSETPSQPTLSD